MDWQTPLWLLAAPPLFLLLWWINSRSQQSMGQRRRLLLLVIRCLTVLSLLLALADPACWERTGNRALGIVVDASQSMGLDGAKQALAEAVRIQRELPKEVATFSVLIGDEPQILSESQLAEWPKHLADWQKIHGKESDYRSAIELARSLFPPGASRELLVIGDGYQTLGRALSQARLASARGERVHVMPLAGPLLSDVRLTSFAANSSRIREGASIDLTARVESTMDAEVQLRLFEEGIEVDETRLTVLAGESVEHRFSRAPHQSGLITWRAVVETRADDPLPDNNERVALADVRGRMRVLYLDSDPTGGDLLQAALRADGIDWVSGLTDEIPASAEAFAAFDLVIIGGMPAHQLGAKAMVALRDYVDRLGGGLIMLGSDRTFALGGYLKTPIESVLPVNLRTPDDEEKQSVAMALVMDRSGSMAGERLEMAKSAAVATAEVLGRMDSLGVFAFDSETQVVAPMTRLTTTSGIVGQIASLTAGGGTNLEPALLAAREALRRVPARLKHMLILTDGQTAGTGYETLAALCRSEGITVSTVAVGEGSHIGLLQAIAASGGGQAYATLEAEEITRIFTQDALTHSGRVLREEPIGSRIAESHPILRGFEDWQPPPLLGMVRVSRKLSGQVPLVTDLDDPLLAHWRYGLGKVTAFTSDATHRWATLWSGRWPRFNEFWVQVVRHTARTHQSGSLNLRATLTDDQARITVEKFAADAHPDLPVTVRVLRSGTGLTGDSLQEIAQFELDPTGPGLSEGCFSPDSAGVYLVQAFSGSDWVSAGLVHQPQTEAALGTVHSTLAQQLADTTGGQMVLPGQTPLLVGSGNAVAVTLRPSLLLLAILLILIDLGIRRWENVLAILQNLQLVQGR